MTETSPEVSLGWDGPHLPMEIQALVLMRKYRSAVAIVAANAARLHHEVERRLSPIEDGGQVASVLADDPFFVRLLDKMQVSYEEFGDKSFRRTAAENFAEAGDELEDMITWMSIGLWIMDGASFPAGLLDMHGIEESDEEE